MPAILRRTGGLTLAVALLISLAGCMPGAPQVGVVDLDTVAKALGRDDVMAQQLQSANQQLTTELGQIAQQLQSSLNERRVELEEEEPEGANEQVQALTQQANQQLNATRRLAQQKSAQFRNQLVADFYNDVRPVVQEVARSKGISLVVTATPTNFWYEDTIDLTDEVIAALRANPPAPPQAAEPSTEGDS